MKNRAIITAIAAALGNASYAFAASGAEYEGSSLLLVLFLGFGAMIIALQFVPGAVMLFSLFKGLVSPAAGKSTVARTDS